MRLARRSFEAALCGALIFAVGPSEAHHVVGHDQNPDPPLPLGGVLPVHFEAGSLIIPMDGCYQRMAFMSNANVSTVVAPDSSASLVCQSNAEKDDGIIP